MNYSDYRVRKYWGEKQNLFNIFTIWGFGTACVVRFNREDSKLMEKKCLEYKDIVINKIEEAAKNSDCIVIKDHEKGFITADLVKKISKIANDNKIPLFVDPKYKWDKFNDINIKAILPNIKEASYGLLGKENESEIRRRWNNSTLYDDDYKKLVDKYPKCENIIIKADRKGAFIVSANIPEGIKPKEIMALPLQEKEFNTGIGCGDVFNAYAIVGILSRHAQEKSVLEESVLEESVLEESVLFANFVAGLRAKKSLGQVMSPDEIKSELKNESTHFNDYIIKNEQLVETIGRRLIEQSDIKI
jgi:bifunctional ADP-heptose synthase (sugar kinase/adenylyltransferase)